MLDARSMLSGPCSAAGRKTVTELKGISPASPQGKMFCFHESSPEDGHRGGLPCPPGTRYSLQGHFLSLWDDHCGKVNHNEVLYHLQMGEKEIYGLKF